MLNPFCPALRPQEEPAESLVARIVDDDPIAGHVEMARAVEMVEVTAGHVGTAELGAKASLLGVDP